MSQLQQFESIDSRRDSVLENIRKHAEELAKAHANVHGTEFSQVSQKIPGSGDWTLNYEDHGESVQYLRVEMTDKEVYILSHKTTPSPSALVEAMEMYPNFVDLIMNDLQSEVAALKTMSEEVDKFLPEMPSTGSVDETRERLQNKIRRHADSLADAINARTDGTQNTVSTTVDGTTWEMKHVGDRVAFIRRMRTDDGEYLISDFNSPTLHTFDSLARQYPAFVANIIEEIDHLSAELDTDELKEIANDYEELIENNS